MRILLFSIIFCGLFLSSCELGPCINKDYFINTFDRFIKDFEEGHERYSSADWESKQNKVNSFVNDCYASFGDDITADEKLSFWTKYVEFMIIRYKTEALQKIETADRSSEVEIYKEIKESIGEVDFQKLFKEIYGDEMEKAVDDVLKELNKWGGKLKDWLNNKN